jgi:hypothetical protein
MSKALKQYSKFLKKKLAAEEILKDLKPLALRELKKCKDGQAVVDDVEYHLTTKSETIYPESVTERIKELRDAAKESGKTKTKTTEAFDAQIPKSVKETVLSKILDYKKYFVK